MLDNRPQHLASKENAPSSLPEATVYEMSAFNPESTSEAFTITTGRFKEWPRLSEIKKSLWHVSE
jgi:hypothetical protein